MYLDLIQNASLMVALTTLYSLLARLNGYTDPWGKILLGFLFGAVAVVGMQLPFHYAPGVIYDGRSIILSMAGLFGGGIPAFVSMMLAGAYRAQMGGAGVWAGLATIIGCAGVGLVFRRGYGNRPENMGILLLYGFGISVHLIMLACQLLILPWPAGLAVIHRIWLPILLVFPIVTVLMGLFLGTEERRILAVRRLQESEALLARSQSVGHVGSWEYDIARKQLTWSDEVYRIFGLYPQKFPATYEFFLNCVHPEDRPLVDATYQESVKKGKDGYEIEHRIIRHDNKAVRIVHERCEHLKDASGRIIRSVGVIQDFTARKQAENLLLKSEMQFKQVFEHVGIGIAIYQPAENGNDFIFKDINPAGAKIGQKPQAAHIGKSVLEIYPGVKEMGLFAVFQEVLKSGGTKHHPIAQYKDKAIAFWTDNYVSRLPSGEIMAVYEDVTAEKQSEETLKNINVILEKRVAQRTAELREANKELEDFVYSVSHDLRAPLRSISGFAEIIDRRHKTSLNEEGQHYFDNIIKASKQMGGLIDDLLKFSRLGRLSIKSEKISLNDVFKTAMETLSGEIEKTRARINIPAHMPAVQGDLTLTTHVFINLLENALKYHKPDIPPVIDIGFEIQAPHVIISIADNGIGIDPAYHEKIFKIFQRLHSLADYPGTGIGLAAVKKALQIMNGEVQVESAPEQGSVFKIKSLMAEAVSAEGNLQ